MAACTNNGGSRARRAVTAALVGVLSVGAVPMMALAANDGISTLAMTEGEAFNAGTLTKAEDASGRTLSIPSDGIITVTEGNWVVPTQVTPKDSDPVDLVYSGADKNATVYWTNNFDGAGTSVTPSTTTMAAGRYSAVVSLDGVTGSKFVVNFRVEEAKTLDDAFLFDNCDGAGNTEDTTFTFNADEQDLGVAIDDVVLKEGYDYTLSVDGGATIQNAGTYGVTINGAHDYAGQTKKITVTVNKLDLSKASVSIADVIAAASYSINTVTADGTVLQNSNSVAPGYVGNLMVDITSYTPSKTGKITAKVYAASGATNITGSQEVTFNAVNEFIGSTGFLYDEDDFATIRSAAKPYVEVDVADGESFKPSKLSVVNSAGKALDSSYYTVTYTDSRGNVVDSSALANPGTYKVNVRVNAEACSYDYGSATETITVKVVRGDVAVDGSGIVFRYDGKVDVSFKRDYNGEDFLSELETIVHTEGGDDLVEGTDYTVKAYDAKGDEVDEIVNAGTYTVVLDMPGLNDQIAESLRTCNVTINKLNLGSNVCVGGDALKTYTFDANDDDVNDTTIWYLSYTGEELEPTLEFGYYTGADGKVAAYDASKASELTWHALPEDAVTVTGYDFTKENAASATSVKAIKDKGAYQVEFVLESGNYTVSGSTTQNAITVTDKAVAFSDVDANAWYAQGVFDAKQLGYVKGVNGTDIFAPESSISRADAVIIIARMAGADQTILDDEDFFFEYGGYMTRYSDVDAGAYYAKAIAWATKVGIVNGYGDGSTFGPNDSITREQFAGMLMNYAKATGEDVSVDADAVLAEFPDGAQVSDWAKDAVAWAADNDVMGNGGQLIPGTKISRAEVACMAVNYQPEGASSDVIG